MNIILRQLLLFFFIFSPATCWPANRLNIVFIIGDDWGGPYAGAYKGLYGRASPSDIIKTPNIDRIAKNGVLFKNAFVSAPSCTASRSAIISGRHFFNTKDGAFLGGTWDMTIPSIPLLLRDAGYHFGVTNKGWSPGAPPNAALGGFKTRYQHFGKTVNHFSAEVTDLMNNGLSFEQAKQTMTDQVLHNFEFFLAARQPNQPFFYWFGPTTTHRPIVKGSGKALWGINPENLKGKLKTFLPDVPEVREDMADYLGEIQALDAYVGVILKKLEDIGELDNTLIIATGDNGPSFPRGKANVYDLGVATPLIMWLPHSKGGRIVSDFTALIDLAPTFLEVAGLPIPAKVAGHSLVNILTSPNSGLVDPHRTFAITGMERGDPKDRENSLPYPMRALRNAYFLYIRNFAPDRWPISCPVIISTLTGIPSVVGTGTPTGTWIVLNRNTVGAEQYFTLAFAKRPKEELYAVIKDPGQINNLADNPAYTITKTLMANKLLTELKKAADPRLIGDGGTFDRPPYTDLKPVVCQDTIPLDWLPNNP